MKSPEELKSLKEEVETLNKKLSELTDEELQRVSGGFIPPLPKSLEIHKVDEHTGANMKADLPAGQIISEADL